MIDTNAWEVSCCYLIEACVIPSNKYIIDNASVGDAAIALPGAQQPHQNQTQRNLLQNDLPDSGIAAANHPL